MTRYFISDHHLWHENIIRFCDRPFSGVREMNDFLLEMHNRYVQPNDHVSFLGDVTMRRGGRLEQMDFIREMKRYNGHKRLFLGNHDHFPVKVYLEAGFEKIYATWRDEQGVLYSHIPLHPRSLGTAIANVHGHIHNNQGVYEPVACIDKVTQKVTYKPYINVSVEVIDYHPISHEEIMQKVRKEQGQYFGCDVGEEVKR